MDFNFIDLDQKRKILLASMAVILIANILWFKDMFSILDNQIFGEISYRTVISAIGLFGVFVFWKRQLNWGG